MSLTLITFTVTEALVRLVEQGPEPEDVKAGWTAFAMFLLLGLAVALLGFSLVKQLRRAQAARDAGVYGDAPAESESSESDPEDPSSR